MKQMIDHEEHLLASRRVMITYSNGVYLLMYMSVLCIYLIVFPSTCNFAWLSAMIKC